MRQVALENALDRGSRTPSPEPVTHVEEQRALRDETIAAFHTAVDSADDEDDLLIPREKTKDELEREEEEYRTFLEREVGEDLSHLVSVESAAGTSAAVKADAEEEESPKKKKKENKKAEKVQDKGRKSKEEEDHEFLMKCVLSISAQLLHQTDAIWQLHPQSRLDGPREQAHTNLQRSHLLEERQGQTARRARLVRLRKRLAIRLRR